MPPRISVVMPVYNAMPYLPEAVRSIFEQTYPEFELIALDDGSTDGSLAYLNSLHDERLSVVNGMRNIGYTERIRQGIGLARSEFIARQDADDISMPDRFERQIAAMSGRPDHAALFSAYLSIDERGAVTGTVHPPPGPRALREGLFFGNVPCHSTAFIRKQALLEAGNYDSAYEPAEDYELWLRLSEIRQIDALDQVLCKFRIYTTSTTGTRRIQQRRMTNRVKVQAFSRDNGASLSPRAVALYHFTVALFEVSEGNMRAGAEHLRLALVADPTVERMNDWLVTTAVNHSVELGPSGRGLIRTAADERTAAQFLLQVLSCLPQDSYEQLRRDCFPEYHAACAFLYATQKRPLKSAVHLLKSWQCGARHRGNRGLVRQVLKALA
jgi:glycosyltransferase involved in cell wall biosynthesis